MLPEDIKRLERERSIFKATRGGGSTNVDREISLAKAELAKRIAARRDHMNQQRFGYYEEGAKDGAWRGDR